MRSVRPLPYLLVLLLGMAPALAAEPPEDSPRRTETVALIKRSLPAVVAIRATYPGDKPNVIQLDHGSGSVIHPAGYVLTNHHVIKRARRVEAVFSDGRVMQARIVGRYPIDDLALLKLDGPQPFATLPLGRSDDLMLGEPVLVIGTPAGLQHSVSTGIISGLARSSTTQDAFLPVLIQSSAAVNGGNSGGPLINAVGEQIGIITSKKYDAENINFAIAVDRIWELFPQLAAAEVRGGFRLGCQVEGARQPVRVQSVVPDSPAARAGLQPGDLVRRVGGYDVQHAIDFHLALLDRKAGDTLQLQVVRGEETFEPTVTLEGLTLAEPVAESNVTAGLELVCYRGVFRQLPDFEKLTPGETLSVPRVTLQNIPGNRDHFAARFVGLIRIPADGLYTFFCASDDGSRVYVAGERLLNHDGLHGPLEASGLMRLKAGLHPIVVEYFEFVGGEALTLSWEGPDIRKQEVPESVFFRVAPESKPAESASADGKSDEAAPADSKPAEEKPAENTPAEDKPADDKPAEGQPAEDKPADQPPAEEQPAEQQPADQPPAENAPAAG